MKRYTVSVARERLADVLDAAEAGETVVIERRGVRYEIQAQKRRAPRRRAPQLITHVDEALAGGEWTWDLGAAGLEFSPRRRR